MKLFETPLASRFEKLPVSIFQTPREASASVAAEIAALIREKPNAVLGLATGSTPIGVYQELIRLHREEKLSFKNVITFNLDEYYPISPDQAQSYRHFMEERLFKHIDILHENTHVPLGTTKREDVVAHCLEYEKMIERAGGIDLQILGIGRTGHIGFNEPGSLRKSTTRLITLDALTRRDNSGDFQGVQNVPRQALTMGIKTILSARQIILLSFGEHKATITRTAVEGEVSAAVPSTFLQEHEHTVVVMDRAASVELTRVKTPWLSGPIADNGLSWNDSLIRKAVTWLALEHGKAILKLTETDYNEGGLQELLSHGSSAYDLNLSVFRQTQATLTGWPAGRRENDSTQPWPKRILVFSPHPDDDVFSMGGTLLRLAGQGHEVHIAYQVSGSYSVPDDFARRYLEFYRDAIALSSQGTAIPYQHVLQELAEKKPGETDSPLLGKIKALIRRGEARAATRTLGVPEEHLHFLDMPFYETGRSAKNPLGEADVEAVKNLLEKIQPHQIYAAGDIANPHGTHRLCLEAFRRAMSATATDEWRNRIDVWLYRGIWQEWPVHEVDMAVILSPAELLRKRIAIFKHETQQPHDLTAETESHPEFWQRAEARTRCAAELYDKLGLTEYQGLETFARWRS